MAGFPGAPPDQTFKMVVDTGSPFTILAAPPGASAQTNPATWNLYGYGAGFDPPGPLRATFRGWSVIGVPLYPAGDPTFMTGGVLGADFLRGYSVEFRFGALCAAGGSALCSFMTLWGHLGEDASLLEDAGYAVVNFTPFGGGEITADGNPDFLGLRGPLDVPATRVVLRACAVPDAFSPENGLHRLSLSGCTSGQAALKQASGVDLSLMIDTGVGPMVLSASAWARVVAAAAQMQPTPITLPLPAPVPPTPAPPSVPPLYVATWPTPINVLLWATIPRFSLINLEAGADNNPGPCVELGRSRRTEIVSYWRVTRPDLDLCGAACDVDPSNTGEAANSAAYLEISGQIPVAVISDDDPFLQGLRFDVLPRGPSSMAWSAPTRSAARGWSSTTSRRRRALFSPARRMPYAMFAGRPPAAPSFQTLVPAALLFRSRTARAAGQLQPGRRCSGIGRWGHRRDRRGDRRWDGHPMSAIGSSRSVGLPN